MQLLLDYIFAVSRPPVLAILVTFAFAGCGQTPFELSKSPDRNVLLITVDTLRGDALGVDGGPARTPTLDGLAAGGIRFSFAHAQAVVTLPSHASILTGLYPFQHGYRENSGYRLTAGVETLATRLKSAGFRTGAFVGAFPLDARFGLTPGFDLYDGRFDDVGSGAEFLLPERPAPVVVDRAVQWNRQAGRPLVRLGARLRSPRPLSPAAPVRIASTRRSRITARWAATDHALGPLIAASRASARPTLVVVTGDHGESLGEHGELTHGLFAYESTLRVPLIGP
jgi:arylsulfatase A-like enzyme